MKKILVLLFLISTIWLAEVKGQNPIPSWNIPVYHRANFQETSKNISGQGDQVMEKRVLNDQLIVPVRHLKSGMYLLELKVNGKKEGTAKITILR